MMSDKNPKKIGEQRFVEMRAVGEQDKMIIEGYAITFDQPATHEYGSWKFTEVIRKGALDNCDMTDVPLRYNHNDTWCIMARTRNNSLQLVVDELGLKIIAELIDTQSNRDIYKSIQEGLIDKMSFAFTVEEKGDTWTYSSDEDYREVKAIKKLYDVSVVDTPFYDTTSIYARSLELLEKGKKQLENLDLRKKKMKLKYKYLNLEEE